MFVLPQKYPNTPQVEYNLRNGTPLSYLDETTVGYIFLNLFIKNTNKNIKF